MTMLDILLYATALLGLCTLFALAWPKAAQRLFGRRMQYLVVEGYETIVAYRDLEQVEFCLERYWQVSRSDLFAFRHGAWITSENNPLNEQIYLEEAGVTVYRFQEPL